MQPLEVADGRRHVGRGARVGQVSTCRRLGQQQMVLDHRPHDRRVLAAEPHARQHRVDDLHADVGVVARVALADVVHERADQEQVGATDRAHELVGVGDRPQEMTVDVVQVEGVALGQAADVLPLRQVVAEHAVVLE